MSAIRFIPGNMVMHDAVPWGQKWTYYAPHPIDTMLDPDYFVSFASLRGGDTVQVIETNQEKTRVLKFAEFMVVDTNPLEIYVTRKVVDVMHKKPGPKTGEVSRMVAGEKQDETQQPAVANA